jgi:hypothetical protein
VAAALTAAVALASITTSVAAIATSVTPMVASVTPIASSVTPIVAAAISPSSDEHRRSGIVALIKTRGIPISGNKALGRPRRAVSRTISISGSAHHDRRHFKEDVNPRRGSFRGGKHGDRRNDGPGFDEIITCSVR